MSQCLISLRAGKAEADRIFLLLEAEFEDDGFGIAITGVRFVSVMTATLR